MGRAIVPLGRSVGLSRVSKLARAAMVPAYVVVHNSAAVEETSSVIRPLKWCDARTVLLSLRSIIYPIFIRQKRHVTSPIIALRRPVRIRLVAGVGSQTRGELEECPRADGVLVVVALVESEDLPTETSTACRGVPTRGLFIEDSLRQGHPRVRGDERRGEREILLGGVHGRESPHGLIIVALTEHCQTVKQNTVEGRILLILSGWEA